MFRVALFITCGIAASLAKGEEKRLDPVLMMHDPTQPTGIKSDLKITDKSQAAPTIHLEMISYSPGRSFAVINGKQFKEGDLFDNKKITLITKDRVILQNDNKQAILIRWANLPIKRREGDQK